MKPPTRRQLLQLGVPAVLIPGLILAATLGWNWQRELKTQNYYQNERIFPKVATVAAVPDGDTLTLPNGAAVRLLGIDSPNRGEPFYLEAQTFTANLIKNKKVELEYEPSYQDDKFGRLLAYVWYQEEGEKKLLNAAILKAGLARTVFYQDRRKLRYQDLLLTAEASAQKNRLYLWSPVSP
jgi:micrococcal nuclease